AGIAIGVAALVIAMSVVSGYETTLRQTVINIHGDLMILRRGEQFSQRREGEETIRAKLPELVAMTPFALIEALVPSQRKVSGVLLEGVDSGTANFVVNFSHLLIEGEAEIAEEDGVASALIGKGLA